MDERIKQTIFKDIYKVLNEIKRCSSKSRYNILLSELHSLYYLCDELKITDYPKINDYSYKSINIDYMKDSCRFYQQILDSIKYHIKFAENYKTINYDKYDNNFNYVIENKISLNDNIKLVIEFLKKYDSKLLDLFYLLVDNNRVLTIDDTIDKNESLYTPAQTICCCGSYKPYILLKTQNNIADSINIIHELSHCYEYMKNDYISSRVFIQKRHNCLEEVSSYYLQFVYTAYLKNKKIFVQDLEHSEIGYNYACITMLKDLYKSLTNIEQADNIDEELNYSYGIVIAYHFLDRYLNNPEKTKKEIENFILFNGQYNMMEMLEKFNLKEELIDSKILKKYI